MAVHGSATPSPAPSMRPPGPRPRPPTALARVFRVVPAGHIGSVVTSTKLQLGLIGDLGAVHLDVSLSWYANDLAAKSRDAHPPRGVGLYVHRSAPADRPGFPVSHGPCEWIDLEQCFTDSLGAIVADGLAEMLRDLGDEAVWSQLEQLYRERLG